MLPSAAFASLIGMFSLLGFLPSGIVLNFSNDMQVMLAPVSYSHVSFVISPQVIGMKGLGSFVAVTSFISRISCLANFAQVLLIRLMMSSSSKGGLSGGLSGGLISGSSLWFSGPCFLVFAEPLLSFLNFWYLLVLILHEFYLFWPCFHLVVFLPLVI